jgi:hypothetical protein
MTREFEADDGEATSAVTEAAARSRRTSTGPSLRGRAGRVNRGRELGSGEQPHCAGASGPEQAGVRSNSGPVAPSPPAFQVVRVVELKRIGLPHARSATRNTGHHSTVRTGSSATNAPMRSASPSSCALGAREPPRRGDLEFERVLVKTLWRWYSTVRRADEICSRVSASNTGGTGTAMRVTATSAGRARRR